MRKFTGQKLVIASHNAGKLGEIAHLLTPFGVATVPAGDLGLPEPEETEPTFVGNARIKAHFACAASGLAAISDDSGIVVDGLDGAPGVFTADWAQTPDGRDYPMAMARVWGLLEVKQVPEPRAAKFSCTLCLAWPDGHDEIFEGTVAGRLVWPMRGSLGFGFDPMFQPTGHARTFAEMDPSQKQRLSHRADAFAKLVAGCFA